MRLQISVAVLVVMELAAFSAAAAQNNQALWFPRMATPALVALDTAGHREFVAEVRGLESTRGWKASLANDLTSWQCQVVSAVYARINRGTEPGWRVTVRVPADISPELFDLKIASNQGQSVQNQAVSAMPKFDTDFYILHLSDEQIVNDKHTDPSGQYCQTVGTAEEMYWMQEPINLIHPRFCCVTGDEIDYNGALDGWNNWPNWGFRPGAHKKFTVAETKQLETQLSNDYLQCHRGYRVPYVETPGNHDVPPQDKKQFGTGVLWHSIGAQFYERYFGQRSWSFRMGDFYVLMHDWSDPQLEKWAESDYARARADPSIKYKLVGQHFHAYWNGGKSYPFVPQVCDLMLIGHGHTVATIRTSPYFIYEDGPTFKYGIAGFFNFRRESDGWKCDQTASGERNVAKDVWHLFTANGVQKVVRADCSDPMNVTANSVTVTNDLPEEFYDGRVRFVLNKGIYRSVRNGVILAEYNCKNDAKTAVLVKVDIPAKGAITVQVAPVVNETGTGSLLNLAARGGGSAAYSSREN